MANIIIAAGLVWATLSFFSYIQFIHIRSIYNILTGNGRIVSGQDRMFAGRYRVFASVSTDGVVTDARILRLSLLFIPSKILDCPLLTGSHLSGLSAESLNIDCKIQQAVQNMQKTWQKIKPNVNRDVPSIAAVGDDEEVMTYNISAESGNKFLHQAESTIHGLLTDGGLKVNKKPFIILLDTLAGCNKNHSFGTDEVISDKARGLERIVLKKPIDAAKADNLVETILRLITQREKEAQFKGV